MKNWWRKRKTVTPSRKPCDIYVFVSLILFSLSVLVSFFALIWVGNVGKILLSIDVVTGVAFLLAFFASEK